MERIHARALETENRVRMIETHGLRLQALQTMLTNISTQATLLLGFALATYGADLLPYILNDMSPFCLFKGWDSMLIGAVFLLANTCTICFCMMVLIGSSLLVIQSQNAYLLVGGAVAVWRTQQLSNIIFYWYFYALLFFLLDAVLLMWIFLGLPHWIPNTRGDGIGDPDTITTEGVELLICLDSTDPEAHAKRNAFGMFNATLSTMFFVAFVIYGYIKMTNFIRLYNLDALRGGDNVVREEERKSVQTQLRRDVELAKLRVTDAAKGFRAADRQGAGTKTQEIGVKRRELESAQRKLDLAKRRLAEAAPQNSRKNISLSPVLSNVKRRVCKTGSAVNPIGATPTVRMETKFTLSADACPSAAKPPGRPPVGVIQQLDTPQSLPPPGAHPAPAAAAPATPTKGGTGKDTLVAPAATPTRIAPPTAAALGDPTGPQDDEIDSTA